MANLKFTPFGDWPKAAFLIADLPRTIRRSILYGQEKAVRKLAKIVKNHIISQDLPSLTQNPKKRIRNGEERVLIDTATYLSSIGVWQKDYTFYVGVKPGLIEPNGTEISKVAYLLETGTKNIPPRPVWGPSIEEMGGIQGINKIVYLVLAAKLRSKGWK